MKIKFCIVVLLFGLGICAQVNWPDQNKINFIFLTQAPESSSLKKMAAAIPRQLLSAGINNLGTLDIWSFIHKIHATTFRENSSFIPTVSGTRFSALYEPTSKTLVVNTSLFSFADFVLSDMSDSASVKKIQRERVEPLLFHEVLGANGIDDRKYDKSLGAYILLRSKDQNIVQSIDRHLMLAGGTTAVGGGGNDISLWIKLKLLEKAIGKLAVSGCEDVESSQLVLAVLDLNIEGFLECDHYDVIYNSNTREINHCLSSFWYLNLEREQDISIEKFYADFCPVLKAGI